MKKLLWIVMGAMMTWSPSGWSIGRAGNGTSAVDPQLGFEANIPQRYFGTKQYDDNSLKVFSASFGHSAMMEEYLHFVPLFTFLPEVMPLDRSQSTQWMQKNGGVPMAHNDPCIDAHLFESSNLVYVTAQWGVGKGVGIFAPLTAKSKQDIMTVLQSLRLEAGACEWK